LPITEGAVVGLGLAGARTAAGAGGIRVGESALAHVIERHGFESAAENASKFAKDVDLRGLIRAAEKVEPTAARGDALQRVVNTGHSIGVDRVTGKATSMYTVITDRAGNLITMHPGAP
jgi:hypothetical protein